MHDIKPELIEKAAALRFWEKVERGAACWLWRGALNSKGYGSFWHRGSAVGAHRWAYEALVGPVPEGLHIDHLCRVRHCVNPHHMEPVTVRENSLRGVSHSPLACRNGHPRTPETTHTRPNGERYCRECKRIRDRRDYQKKARDE